MQTSLGTTPHGGRTNETDPDFAWRVLDQMPAALVIVDAAAQVVYANAALIRLLGRDLGPDASVNILDYVHPDDAGWLAEAFLDVVEDDASGPARTVLPSIHIRIVDGSGETIPLEITGARTITDDVVGGVIYDVRPARYHDVLGHVLNGLSSGTDVTDLLTLVSQLIALPPLDLGAVVLELTDDGSSVLSATTPSLGAVFAAGIRLPDIDTPGVPARVELADLGAKLTRDLEALGFVDVWRLSIGADGYEIVACARRRERRSTSVLERLTTARELASVASKQAASETQLRHAARHDSLTGVYNRATFREYLGAALHGLAHRPAGVLFLDLDRFKPVNDEHGHGAGDQVLQTVARRLSAAVRPTDIVARLGGDEFAVLLTSPESVSAATAISERIIQSIAAPINIDADDGVATVQLSVSVGAVTARPDDDVDRILGRADRLMYTAKRDAGGAVRADD